MTRGAELQRIAREGKRIRTTHLEVRAAASPLAHPAGPAMRVGFVVPRFKHSAVDRNRLKRRLRELTRLRLLPTALQTDVVVRIRPDAYRATFEVLTAEVDSILVQLRRWLSARDAPVDPPVDPAAAQAAGTDVTNTGPTA